MIKEFNLNQEPVYITGWYDLDKNNGLINKLYLSKSKSMESMYVYMFIKYGIKMQLVDFNYSRMIFNTDNIEFSFDPDLEFVENIVVEINDIETFNKFINMFLDEEYSLKVHRKKIKFYNKSMSDWYVGAEIEMKMVDEYDTPYYRNNVIKEINKKYGDVLFTQTENFRYQFIEMITYPMPIKDMYRIRHVIDYASTLKMDLDWSCNFQLHVCKKKLGSTIEEAMQRVNKILLFIYNTDDLCKNTMFNKKLVDWDLCPTIHDLVHRNKYFGISNLSIYEKYNLCELLLNNQHKMRQRLAPYLNIWRLFNDFDNEPTLEFRLSDIVTFDKKRLLLPVAYVEYCITVICEMPIEEVDKVTAKDFLDFYDKKYEEIKDLGDYNI